MPFQTYWFVAYFCRNQVGQEFFHVFGRDNGVGYIIRSSIETLMAQPD